MNGSTTPARNSSPQIDREVRNPHRVRERARLCDRRGRAAAALGVVLGIGPQLERHRDRGAALRALQRRNRAVDAAAHRHERAATGSGRQRACSRTAAAERPRQRVGGELGGVQLARAQPAELGGDLGGPDPSGLEQRPAAHERDGGAPGGGRCATARRLEARVGYGFAVDADREPHPVAARAAADGHRNGAGRQAIVALRRGQVVLEGEAVHPVRG